MNYQNRKQSHNGELGIASGIGGGIAGTERGLRIGGDRVAERRMIAKTIIDSDAFLDMPQSTQLLYFHLAMRGDDDGFVNKPKTIMRITGASDDDIKLLIAKKFIIPFESGVVVIKHWKIHNYIQKDRYKETKYKDEKAMLELDNNKAYRLMDTRCIQDVSNLETQVRLGKVRLELGKVSNSANKSHRFTPPTLEEVTAYCQERNKGVDPQRWYDFYTAKGWMIGKNKMKDWKAAVRTWENKQDKPISGNIFLQEDV